MDFKNFIGFSFKNQMVRVNKSMQNKYEPRQCDDFLIGF